MCHDNVIKFTNLQMCALSMKALPCFLGIPTNGSNFIKYFFTETFSFDINTEESNSEMCELVNCQL